MSIIIVVWFVCTQIGYIHAHLLAGTQLFCPRIIWNITASERLFKITKNKRTGGKKSSVEGKKKKNNGGCQCHGSDIHDSDMFARFAKMIRFVEETHDPNKQVNTSPTQQSFSASPLLFLLLPSTILFLHTRIKILLFFFLQRKFKQCSLCLCTDSSLHMLNPHNLCSPVCI